MQLLSTVWRDCYKLLSNDKYAFDIVFIKR